MSTEAARDPNLVVQFKTVSTEDKNKSREAGRPIFYDLEICEIRFAGNRESIPVFPAHAFAGYIVDEFGASREVTYAEKYSAQYRRFKEKKPQIAEGTPLSELPFLSESKRSEYRALGVHTAEALAALDGPNLKNLGTNGRAHKNQAQAYLDRANGSAGMAALAEKNILLEEQLADMRQQMAEMQAALKGKKADPVQDALDEQFTPKEEDEFQSWSDDDLKIYIADITGSRPKGNPSHATLVTAAREAHEAREAAAA